MELKFDVYGTQSCNENYHQLSTPHIGFTMLECHTKIPWSWSYGNVDHKGNGCGEEEAHNTIPQAPSYLWPKMGAIFLGKI